MNCPPLSIHLFHYGSFFFPSFYSFFQFGIITKEPDIRPRSTFIQRLMSEEYLVIMKIDKEAELQPSLSSLR
jgi:hypothetical protein